MNQFPTVPLTEHERGELMRILRSYGVTAAWALMGPDPTEAGIVADEGELARIDKQQAAVDISTILRDRKVWLMRMPDSLSDGSDYLRRIF